MLTCFRLTKGRATFFQPETIVASFFASYDVISQTDIQSCQETLAPLKHICEAKIDLRVRFRYNISLIMHEK